MGLLSEFLKKSKSEIISDVSNHSETHQANLPEEVTFEDEFSGYSVKQAEEDFERFAKLDDQQLCPLLEIRFKDGVEAALKNVAFRDTYAGLIEGSPVYASRRYWVDLKNEFDKNGSLLLEPTLVRSCFSDGYCLPSIKVIATFEAGFKLLNIICFFANEYPSDCTLKEFIERTTRDIDFEANSVEWEP